MRPRPVTTLRLMNIKREIIGDDDFRFRVIERHGVEELTVTAERKTYEKKIPEVQK